MNDTEGLYVQTHLDGTVDMENVVPPDVERAAAEYLAELDEQYGPPPEGDPS